MQIAAETTRSQSLSSATLSEFSVTVGQSQFSQYGVIRCNGAVVSLEFSEIPMTETEVFFAVDGTHGAASGKLQLLRIAAGLGKPLDLGDQTGSAPNWDQLMGPIG